MSGRRILVVGDDPDVRSLVRELLTRAGYELDEAPDGPHGPPSALCPGA